MKYRMVIDNFAANGNIMKGILLIVAVALLSACAMNHNKFTKKTKAQFDASPVVRSFTSVADLNDAYFDLKANNYFEFYRQLFDTLKNTQYPGKYRKEGDTLYLSFFDKKGPEMLGKKAVIKNDKIIFYP